MKNVKLVQHTLSALIFSSSVLLTSATAVFANEQLTSSRVKPGGEHGAQHQVEQTAGQVDEFGMENVVQKVNINLASYAQLIALPGIGRVKAMAIIKYRKEVGMFSNLEDIQKIKGIGVKLFARLQKKIKI